MMLLNEKLQIQSTQPSPPQEPPDRSIRIGRKSDGQIVLFRGKSHAAEEAVPVRLSLCFPWSHSVGFVSVRDAKGNELALIRNLSELDPASRSVMEMAVAEAGFVLEIKSVDEVEDEFELRVWKVRTKNGARRFQTKIDDWPRPVPGGGLLIRDVSGDLFYISKPSELDEKSQKLLWVFID